MAERLQHLSTALNGVIALKRRIIEDLRPSSSLANLGLTAAIDILVREFSQQAGIDVQASLDTVALPETTQPPCTAWCRNHSPTSANTPRRPRCS